MNSAIQRLNLISWQLQQESVQQKKAEFPMLSLDERDRYFDTSLNRACNSSPISHFNLMQKDISSKSEALFIDGIEVNASDEVTMNTKESLSAATSLKASKFSGLLEMKMTATNDDEENDIKSMIDGVNDTILVIQKDEESIEEDTLESLLGTGLEQVDYLHIDEDFSTSDLWEKYNKREYTVVVFTEKCLKSLKGLHEHLDELKDSKGKQNSVIAIRSDEKRASGTFSEIQNFTVCFKRKEDLSET